MIFLKKTEKPEVLARNGASWLAALKNRLAANEEPTVNEKTRYRHQDIKQALKVETSGKCAYCESFLLDVAFGDVEHIVPKSLDVDETFRWENLTLACDVCNTYKSNAVNLVDPYVDDPEDHFTFLGPMVVPNLSSAKGVITEKRLKLNRGDLLSQRGKRLDAIAKQILLIRSTKNKDVKSALLDDLLTNEAGPDTEYTAIVRSFIKFMQDSGQFEADMTLA